MLVNNLSVERVRLAARSISSVLCWDMCDAICLRGRFEILVCVVRYILSNLFSTLNTYSLTIKVSCYRHFERKFRAIRGSSVAVVGPPNRLPTVSQHSLWI